MSSTGGVAPAHATRKRAHPSVYRRRRLIVFGGLGFGLSFLVFVGLVLGLPLPSAVADVTIDSTVSGTAASLSLPPAAATEVWANGYGTIVDAADGAERPIASMTKVITALMVLKAHPLSGTEPGPTLTFSQADVDIIGDIIAVNGNYSDVAAGDTTTERDALTVMLMKSSNNIATSLAVWAYGSMEAYLTATADWLAENDLVDTHVADASGLNSATTSSPDNMVSIGRLAMENSVIAQIVGTSTTTLPLFGEVKNGNTLLGFAGISGIKTGTTDDAGACLLYSATFSVGDTPVSVVGVTMGGPRLQAELQPTVAEFMASVEAGFSTQTLADPGIAVGTFTTQWSSTADIVPKNTITRVLWSDQSASISVVLNDVRGGRIGDEVGTLTVVVNGEKVTTPLILNGDLGDPGPGWRFTHVASLFG